MNRVSAYRQLIEALYEAIPEEAKQLLRNVGEGAKINGGTSRGWDTHDAAVCTYNNTVKNQEEIIDWYERALLVIQTTQGKEQ